MGLNSSEDGIFTIQIALGDTASENSTHGQRLTLNLYKQKYFRPRTCSVQTKKRTSIRLTCVRRVAPTGRLRIMKPGDQISSPSAGPLTADITSQHYCSITSLGIGLNENTRY